MRFIALLAMSTLGCTAMAVDTPQSLSQEEFSSLTMDKIQGGKNPLYLEPPTAVKDRTSLVHFIFLLKRDQLGLRSGLARHGGDGPKRLEQIEYFEVEQSDGSEKCYTYRADAVGAYRRIDLFTKLAVSDTVMAGDLDLIGGTFSYYSHGGKLIRQVPLPP